MREDFFDAARAEEEEVSRRKLIADTREQLDRARILVVADGAAEEERKPRPGRRRQREVRAVVRLDTLHRDLWVGGEDHFPRPRQRTRADVHRRIAGAAAETQGGVEQRHRFRGGPAAQLDHLSQVGAARRLHAAARLRLEQRPLGPRRVVLGKGGDVLEERGSAIVIEILAGDFRRSPGEPCSPTILGKMILGRARL